MSVGSFFEGLNMDDVDKVQEGDIIGTNHGIAHGFAVTFSVHLVLSGHIDATGIRLHLFPAFQGG